MNKHDPVVIFRYYGISPWEIEVAYSYFNSRFSITQQEVEPFDDGFVSVLHIDIPFPFSDDFFDWFDFRRWEKVKALLKEMKRRRGSGNGLKVQISFAGSPAIRFVLDARDRQWYDNAVEKIDFVLELLPYHMDPKKLPESVTDVFYRFDESARRWRLSMADTDGGRYVLMEKEWRKVT